MRDGEYAMVAFEGYRPPGVRLLLGIRHLGIWDSVYQLPRVPVMGS